MRPILLSGHERALTQIKYVEALFALYIRVTESQRGGYWISSVLFAA
jgi:hypothetical protein